MLLRLKGVEWLLQGAGVLLSGPRRVLLIDILRGPAGLESSAGLLAGEFILHAAVQVNSARGTVSTPQGLHLPSLDTVDTGVGELWYFYTDSPS